MTSFLTQTEIDALQKTELSRKAPFAVAGVRHGVFSVARHFGGATYKGWGYKYFADTDELIRRDVVKWVMRQRRFAAKMMAAENAQKTVDLFGGGV